MYSDMFSPDFPKACPIIDGRPFRWSVGFYRGKHRRTVAWFETYADALTYLKRFRADFSHVRFDIVASLF